MTRADLATRLRDVQAELRGRLARRDALATMVKGVNAALEPEKVAEAIADTFAAWIPAAGCAVMVSDLSGPPTLAAGRAVPAEVVPLLQEAAAWVMRHGESFGTARLAADARIARQLATAGGSEDLPHADSERIGRQRPATGRSENLPHASNGAGLQARDAVGAALAIPLAGRRALGAVVAFDRAPAAREPRLAPATERAIVELLEPAGIALENAMHLQRAEALSVTDDLTRLYNSRYLNQVLRRESKRSVRSGRPLSLLFIDLDGFKAVNDNHGHLAGSRALVETAVVLRDSARETDVVARFGGDEFALVLPETNTQGAEFVARRIRERIADHRFLVSEGLDIHLTASVGIATLPDVARTPEELMAAADRAMYRVKDRGKDGIEVARARFWGRGSRG